jgi:hypothetical protein
MQAVLASIKLEPEFHTSMLRVFIDQVIRVYGSSGDFLREDVHPEKSESNGIYDTALALPILTKDIVLTREKVENGLGK